MINTLNVENKTFFNKLTDLEKEDLNSESLFYSENLQSSGIDDTVSGTINATNEFTNCILQAENEAYEEEYSAVSQGETDVILYRFMSPLEVQRNGTIEDTCQHATGDCWLLSGVNALNYTEQGKEYIKNALDYQDDGTIVHLITGDYYVSNEEVLATYETNEYATGDDDMIILELAIEKAREEVINHDIECAISGDGTDEQTLQSGRTKEAIFYLTGKMSVVYTSSQTNDIISALNEYQENNHKDMTLTADFTEDKEVEDVNGETVTLHDHHAYAIKSVDDETVTIINPWNSSEEIVISRETFMDNVQSVEACDLSSDNPEADIVTRAETKDNDDGTVSKIYEHDYQTIEYVYKNGQLQYKITLDDYTYLNSSSQTQYVKTIYEYDSELNRISSLSIGYDENFNETYSEKYYFNGNNATRIEIDNDGDGETDYIEERTYDENGVYLGSKYDRDGDGVFEEQ